MRNEPIDRIMTESPVTLAPGDSLAKARDLFASSRMHHFPVVEAEQLVGILSATDFRKLHLLKSDNVLLERATVRQLMQANPVVLSSDATLRDAAEKLLEGEIHALPVVDTQGGVKGIITTSDLVQYMLHHVPRDDGSLTGQVVDSPSPDEENRLQKAVCTAAEHYIGSGHADHELSVLVKRLDELHRSRPIRL